MPTAETSALVLQRSPAPAGDSQEMSRLGLLYQVAEYVNSTLDLRECLDRIIDGANRIFGADKLSLMLLDDDASEMRIVAARNIPDDVVAKTVVKLGAGFSGKVAESGEALVVGDMDGDARFLRRDERQYRTRSFAIVPLKHKGRVLGVINLTNRADGRPFCDGDLELLTALANQAAIAIENSRPQSTPASRPARGTRLLPRAIGRPLRSPYGLPPLPPNRSPHRTHPAHQGGYNVPALFRNGSNFALTGARGWSRISCVGSTGPGGPVWSPGIFSTLLAFGLLLRGRARRRPVGRRTTPGRA